MKLQKGNDIINLSDIAHINAFLTDGWVEFIAPPIQEVKEVKKAPIKKGMK